MAVTTPSFTVQWATGAAPGDVQYPTAGVEATGYLDGQPLPHEEFNGLVQRLGDWTVWLEDLAGDDSANLKFGSSTANGLRAVVDTADLFVLNVGGPGLSNANTGALRTAFVSLTGADVTTGLPEFTIMTTGGNNAVLLRTVDSASLTELTFARTGGGATRFTADTLRAANAQTIALGLYNADFDPASNLVDLAVATTGGRAVIEASSPNADEVSLLINHVDISAFASPADEVMRIRGGSGEDIAFEYATNLPTDYNRLELLTEGTRPTIFAVDNARLDGVIDFQAGSPTAPLTSIGQFTRTVGRQNICRAKCVVEFEVDGSGNYGAPTIVSGSAWNIDSVSTIGEILRVTLVDAAPDPAISMSVYKNFVEAGPCLNLAGTSASATYVASGATIDLTPYFINLPTPTTPSFLPELTRTGLTPGGSLFVAVTVH